jgi:hypothetical protein
VSHNSSPYKDLEPDTWRGLLARAAVFHAARRRLGRLADLADEAAEIGLVLLDLQIAAKQLAQGDAEEGALIAAVIGACEAAIDRVLSKGSAEASVAILLAELRDLVGGAREDDPFQGLLRGVESQARLLYGDAWRPTTLSVAYMRSHPRGPRSSDPYAVTAVTPFPTSPQAAQIELHVCCEMFGPALYAVLPMVLTHECVCHVAARQDRANNDSSFAEGLLDWAAYHFFDLWAGKVDPELAPAARRHAQRLREVLCEGNSARIAGHAAAEQLRAWFESELGQTGAESVTSVAHLAVALNKAEGSLAAKDEFVSLIGGLPLPPDVDSALRSWAAGRLEPGLLLGLGHASAP